MGTSAFLGHFARTPLGRLHGFADMSQVDWRFTTADARIKLKRLYPSIQPG